MGLNDTPSAERVHIGFFGRRNAGKSSVVNAVTGQKLAIVSDVLGTTTDPVFKTMELLPLGPVVIIDTAGIDDTGELGRLRMEKSRQVIRKTDIAVLVVDANTGKTADDEMLIRDFQNRGVPYIIAYNKSDLLKEIPKHSNQEIYISAKTGANISELKGKIAHLKADGSDKRLISDKLKENDIAVLVVPIDSAAPKGRLILPQQQTIRDILEAGAIAIVTKETQLPETLKALSKSPRMVITDSQAFEQVAKDTPRDIPLTSFSILFARYKGDLKSLADGARALDNLKDGDKVLISEGCTHHRQCDDIGSVKLPKWIREYTKKDISFEFTSGTEFYDDLSRFSLVVHCGGCMLNEREMRHRIASSNAQGVPMTNYGVCIAQIKGILKRSLEVFPEI